MVSVDDIVFPTIVTLLPATNVACFASNALCNPLVFAIVKSPSLIVFCFPANELVIVVEKLASLSNAVASSFNVSKAPGAPPTKLSIAVFTNAVVAIFVELSVANCVVTLVVPDAVKSVQVTLLSFNNTPSIVTPAALVFSLIVSVDNVPVIDISPPDTPLVPPDNNIVELFALSLTSKSLKLPCLDAEMKFVPPTA